MNPALQAVLNRADIWSGDSLAKFNDSIASGYPELDATLPGSGWPAGALTEILLERHGIGELRLLLPALSRLSKAGREVVFIAPPHIPYAPALVQNGIELVHFLWVRALDSKDKLWAAEQALRSGACGAVACWLPGLNERVVRRLQSAAEHGKTWAINFDRSPARATPAALRLQLSPAPDALRVQIVKRRGGWTAPLL